MAQQIRMICDENVDPNMKTTTNASKFFNLKKGQEENDLKKQIFKTSIQNQFSVAAPTFLSENSFQSFDSGVEDIDAGESHLPQMLSHHVVDIYWYLRWKETHFLVEKQFLNGKKVTPVNRAKLLDWLVSVHLNFKLQPETLYLTKQLLDSYLSKTNISNRILQLVGITCVWLASKFEEIYPPTVDDLLYVTENIFDQHEMNDCERSIIKIMNFDVNIPTSLAFLKRAAKSARVDITIYNFAKYILEQSFLEYEMAHYLPSHLAAASLYLATILIRSSNDYNNTALNETCWSKQATYYTAYTEMDLKSLASELCQMLQKNSSASKRNEVFKKFRHKSFSSVSRLPVCLEAVNCFEKYIEIQRMQKMTKNVSNKLRIKNC